ncbi:MAG TPA: hypothetical protein PKI93_07645 [Alphaproteobacteria bacterium]|nr:hypothetical protein [Alphaproteobacteria bacterium]HNS44070.1 hypothetical protein [Alphaproteobacteria bacterium]
MMGALAMERVDLDPRISESTVYEFDVISAFSGLDTSRKMVLFDQLMGHRVNAYRNTMKTFWPESTEDDARKLEMMLRSRMNRLKTAM